MYSIQPLHLVLAAHFLLTCVCCWMCVKDRRAADRWQALAESMKRRERQDTAKTIAAPAWHAPRISARPGPAAPAD